MQTTSDRSVIHASSAAQRTTAGGPTDDELLQALALGDSKAFAKLVKRHSRLVVGLAARLSGSRADAEEVAQEVFIRVWHLAAKWSPANTSEGSFKSWLYRVTVNLVYDRRRRPTMVPIDPGWEPADESDDGFDSVYNQELSREVTQAVLRLPSRQRRALTLCFFQGRSNAEAADLMADTIGAIESVLVRARRTLRKELESLYCELSSK